MRYSIMISVLFILLCGPIFANEPEFSLDSNTAFYEGERFSYVMSPPEGFRMVTYKAKFDGYSFAFIPENDFYDSASTLVGVHIYKIRGLEFEEVITSDTNAIRTHYGPTAEIRPVDPIKSALEDSLLTFYLGGKTSFIPNVMISYFNGETELIVYELVIRSNSSKIRAEEQFVEAIAGFKALVRAELGQR